MIKDNYRMPFVQLMILTIVTFLGILTELVPSGVLIPMSRGLHTSYSQIGSLIGVYAVASAIGAIPLITLTMEVNRKTILISLLIGFALSNVIIAFSSSYILTAFARMVGGLCAGVLWPLVTGYAMRLVSSNFSGRALAITMSGSTLGLGIGLPIVTSIGTVFGWRSIFIILSFILFLLALAAYKILPALPGEKRTKQSSPVWLIRNRRVLIVLLVTFLSVFSHYALYTYLSPFAQSMHLSGGVSFALLLFGTGTILGVIITGKLIDSYLRRLLLMMFLLTIIAMVVFQLVKPMYLIIDVSIIVWGISFGGLPTILQTSGAKQVNSGKDVLTSIQTTIYNLAIFGGSLIGGIILNQFDIFMIVNLIIVLMSVALLSVFLNKKVFSRA